MRLYALCFAAGVCWLQVQAALPALQAVWLAVPLALSALLVASPRTQAIRYARHAGIAALCVACGVGWAAWLATVRLADALPENWEQRDIQVVGVVATLPQPYERSLRFEFDIERTLTPDARVPAHIMLSWWGSPARGDKRATLPELKAGERWQFTVRLRQPHGTLNPHGFDYEAWLLERGLRATGYVRPAGARKLAEFVLRPQYMIERLRASVRARLQAALADAPYAGVLIALAIGDQRAIPETQWQVYTRTGVNHLMSISGLHVTMLSGLAFALCYYLWRSSARLTLRLPARKAATIAGLVTAFAYAWLSGFAVPAQRTVYMLAVIAAALWAGRQASATVVLCAALVAVLAIDPWAILAAGFWLSFGAVAVIMFVSTGRIGKPYWLASWGRVQWAVTLGLVPLLLAMFQQISLISPVANAVAIPVVSLAVVPLTLLGALMPFDLVLQIAHAVMAACGAMLAAMSSLPSAVWQQHAPPAWAVVAALAGVAWLLLPRGFPARWVGALALLPLFVLLPPLPAPGELRMTVLDVGQGSAVFVQTRSHALLYDAGPAYGPRSNSGNRIIVPYLRAQGVRGLNTLVLTHDDTDHTGGAAAVMQAMPVARVLSSLPHGHPLTGQAPSAGACTAGERWEWDGIRFEILHPGAPHYAREKIKDNDLGCVIAIIAGTKTVLLAADIEQKSERELIAARGDTLRSDVLLVPHHGSRTSSSPEFLAAVRPRYAIVSAGYRNRFGHPRPDVVERYREAGSRLYRTDRDGALTVTIKEESIAVHAFRARHRRYWHAPYRGPVEEDAEAPES